MMKNKKNNEEIQVNNKLVHYIKKNGFTILMVIFVAVMFISPDAKSFVLQQMMKTGIFNATISQKEADSPNETTTSFDFEDEKGNVLNTASLKGKVVFINFWASWCPPCRAEFPAIEALYDKFKDNPNVYFLTLNEDKNFSVARSFMEKEKYVVPFFKTKGTVPAEIYSGSLPTTIVLDKNGNVRYRNEGFANYNSDKFVQQMEELSVEKSQ